MRMKELAAPALFTEAARFLGAPARESGEHWRGVGTAVRSVEDAQAIGL
jgi:hypothetical protein